MTTIIPAMDIRPPAPTRIGLISASLMLATAVLSLLNAGRMPFIDPDEGRSVLIARQMIESGDWLVPRTPLLEDQYFDKPVLHFLLLAGSFHLFGLTEFAARLVSAIGAALMVGATYHVGRVLLTPRAALWSALLLATCGLTTIAGRFVRMDIWFTALIAWGLFFWCRFHFQSASRWALLCGYACLGAAVLTKGLVGILLPFVVVGAFLLVPRARDWAAVRRSHLLLGVGIIALVAGPWFVYMNSRYPGYAWDFFIEHHFLRATTDKYGRVGNPLFLPAMVLAAFLPWSAVLVAAVVQALAHRRDPDWDACRPRLWFCYWWALLGILPFALFRTQLPVYIMPAFPAVALIAGHYVDRLLSRVVTRETRWTFGPTIALMGLSLVALAVANAYTFDAAPWFTLTRRLSIFVLVVGAMVWFLRRTRLAAALCAALLATGALVADVAWVEGPGLAEHFSSREFAAPIAAHQHEANELIVGPTPMFAVFCYLHDAPKVRWLAHKREFFAQQEWEQPRLALLTSAQLVRVAQERFPDRITLLHAGRDAWLVKMSAGPAHQP